MDQPRSTQGSEQAESEPAEYDVSALTPSPFPDAPPTFLIRAMLSLRRWLLRMANRVVPPHAVLFDQCIGVAHTQLLGILARLGIADILEEGPMDAVELAARTESNPDAMHRLMRAAATVGLFELSDDGRFSNNRISRGLRRGQLSRAKEFAEYFASRSNFAAYGAVDHVMKTGRDGFEHANGLDLWEWFDAHPDERENFAQMMMGVTARESPMVARLYPFEEVKRICDVGGGRGTLLSELLIRYPHLEGVLFDRAGVIESARPLLKARGVHDRVELVAGDFFESVTPGCDAYLLKNVMHDWDDGRCTTILKACRKVMPAGGKVLLVEVVVEPNDRTNFGALRDVHVLTVCTGGRERGREDYRRLLESAGFEMRRVFDSPILSVIEGEAVASTG